MIIQPYLGRWGTNSLFIRSQRPIKVNIYARLRMLYDRASLKISLQLAQLTNTLHLINTMNRSEWIHELL